MTWEVAGSTLWSSAELNVAIICACLPMLRPPLQALFPRLFRSISSRSKYWDVKYGYRSGVSSSGDRFSKRFSRQITPGASQLGKEADVALNPIEENHFEEDAERNDQQSDDQPYFIIDEDSEGILKRTEVTVVREETGAKSEGKETNAEVSYYRGDSSETSKRGSHTLGLAL
jgi:hypothetical protein